MKAFLTNFWNDEEGMETIEVLLILSVFIAVALLFKDQLTSWVTSLFDRVKGELGI